MARRTFRRRLAAFTLMELMIVVFIIGVLAATAIPLVGKYLRKSKTAEASLNLRKVYDGEVAYYQEERTTSSGQVLSKYFVSAGPDPSSPNVTKQTGNWNAVGWLSLKFAPDGPVQFSYSTTTSGAALSAAFTARAEGDIDGDGSTSLFERVGSVNSTGEVEGGGAIFSMDETE